MIDQNIKIYKRILHSRVVSVITKAPQYELKKDFPIIEINGKNKNKNQSIPGNQKEKHIRNNKNCRLKNKKRKIKKPMPHEILNINPELFPKILCNFLKVLFFKKLSLDKFSKFLYILNRHICKDQPKAEIICPIQRVNNLRFCLFRRIV